MGNRASNVDYESQSASMQKAGRKMDQEIYEISKEKPDPSTVATLYYFKGRGLADQIRWIMAATNVSFTHRKVDTREAFVTLSRRQLLFGQLPLLQIDGLEIVQSQAIVRYLATRAGIQGATPAEACLCDMIAESCRDLINLAAAAAFQRDKGAVAFDAHRTIMTTKWGIVGKRLEAIIQHNLDKNGDNNNASLGYLVGKSMTYADVITVHVMTWFIEECGSALVADLPLLINLQHKVFNIPSVLAFLKSEQYYPLGDSAYCKEVSTVLDRKI